MVQIVLKDCQKIVAWPELETGSPTDFKGELLRTRLVMLKKLHWEKIPGNYFNTHF